MGLLRRSWAQLSLGDETSTLAKFAHSRHLADLRLIMAIVTIIISVAASVALLISFQHEVASQWPNLHETHSWWIWVRIAFASIANFFVNAGTILGAVGVFAGGVFAWTYQAFRARLAVIAMLAEEITALCRVMAMGGWVENYIAFDAVKTAGGENMRLPQQESYPFVFDLLIKDVQQLDHLTVANVTAFYSHMKITRDSIRKLADIQPADPDLNSKWRFAITNVIYSQFLALQSARAAISDLVEFEPILAENLITILLSELVAYSFLRQQFTGVLRQRLLEARDGAYRRDIPALHRLVMLGQGERWDTAKDLSVEMMKRYDSAFFP